MNILILILLIPLNMPLFKKIFGFTFNSKEDFYESLRYVFTPDIISLFRGEFTKDYFGEMKASIFFMGCGLILFMEYSVIQILLTNLFN